MQNDFGLTPAESCKSKLKFIEKQFQGTVDKVMVVEPETRGKLKLTYELIEKFTDFMTKENFSERNNGRRLNSFIEETSKDLLLFMEFD